MSASIEQHRRYLRKDGLSESCQSCAIVDICGGGSLPHRYDGNGFKNPTVYCNEMTRLITHISNRLQEHLLPEIVKEETEPLPDMFDLAKFEKAETSNSYLNWLCVNAKNNAVQRLRKSLFYLQSDIRANELGNLNEAIFERIAFHPGTLAWSSAVIAEKEGHTLLSVDGKAIPISPDYLDVLLDQANLQSDHSTLDVGRNDFWLRAPFGDAIIFEDDKLAEIGRLLVDQAMDIVRAWRPMLAAEMLAICSAIQFVNDPSADPHKIVSFSDNSVPGALYISISQGDSLIDPYDLADSLIHEHRHQKLYLLERLVSTVERTSIRVASPWRDDLRPPSGLLHAVFVFVELRRFWLHVLDHGPTKLKARALNQIANTNLHLKQAFATLKECPLTEIGLRLVDVLNLASCEGTKSNELADNHSNISFTS